MSPDAELMVIFGVLHLFALVFGVGLLAMFFRSDPAGAPPPPEDDDGGGGGNDRLPLTPKPRPTGGIPLPDARPAGTRLRGHGRLRDAHRRPARRPAHPPLPRRAPVR